jgi:hypothetical protein
MLFFIFSRNILWCTFCGVIVLYSSTYQGTIIYVLQFLHIQITWYEEQAMLPLCGVQASDEHNNCHMQVSKQAILSHNSEQGMKKPICC